MIVCNVCQIEKEDNNFQTYWHSTQNKMRTRKQCNECYYNIRLKRTNPDKHYEDNPNYRKCIKCNEWKILDEYYLHNKDKGTRVNSCKTCIRTKENEDSHRRRELELEDSCGSERISKKPNVYKDKYQRACTFSIMDALGYIYNEPSGVWTKPGWKEINENGKVIFPKLIERRKMLNPYPTSTQKPTVYVTPEMYDRLFDLRMKGYTYKQIGIELDISVSTVHKWLNQERLPKWKDTLK
jgi:hypothetical protein